MPDIRIRRTHSLGLKKAREIAWQWANEVETKFGMECTVLEGADSDTVEFQRSGVRGTLRVAADGFELDAKLGFLLGAFSRTIESEIEKNLDDLLDSSTASTKPAAGERPAAPAAKGKTKAASTRATKAAAKPAVKHNAKRAAGS